MPATNPSAPGARLDYLDAVRAFALLLGIVFHASLSFVPVYIGWAVMDVSTSALVSGFVLVSHSFRMELFFLIAGFFSHMTFHGKGARAFLGSRVLRIAVPFIVGWFILRPLVVSGWVMGAQSLRGEVNIPEGLAAGFASLASLPQDLFVGTHLWFLYYLLLITGITLAVRAVLNPLPGVGPAIRRALDALTAWVSNSPLGLPALAVPTAGLLWLMDMWGMETPDKTLVPDLPVLAVYGACFVLGWLLHRQPVLMERFARLTAPRLLLCLASIAVTLYLARYQNDPGHPQIARYRLLFVIAYAHMMWSLVAVTIGLFKRFLDTPSRVVRYLADASYWLYLVHLPLVVWLQVAVAELPFHWTLKLAAVCTLTVGIALLLYDLFVRSTLIGRVLNGRRRPRAFARTGPWHKDAGSAAARPETMPAESSRD